MENSIEEVEKESESRYRTTMTILLSIVLGSAIVFGLCQINKHHGKRIKSTNPATAAITNAVKLEALPTENAEVIGWRRVIGSIAEYKDAGIRYCIISENGDEKDVKSFRICIIGSGLRPHFKEDPITKQLWVYVLKTELLCGQPQQLFAKAFSHGEDLNQIK